MATKGKRPMRALTPGDKIEAIQRVNDGESKASVARDIGVPESTLRGWCKNEDKLRYMTSRLSSPETDKSNDGEPADKRARTESPAAPPSPATAGLDLTTPAPTAPHAALPIAPQQMDAPVELTTRRAEPSPTPIPPRDRRPDPGASVSMSAISPLSGLAHLPSLAHSHLGLSFNDIASNLTLLAQLNVNPALSALSAQPASRALRSVRSPKPAHNGLLSNETKHRTKGHHSSDPYRHSGSKSNHHGTSAATQPVDDTLWYWLKTQQAMLDLTAQTATHPLQLGKTADPTVLPKPVAPASPLNAHLDYNRNSWLWQYYKQFGGAAPPDDKHKFASQVPKDKNSENILYSHLTKGKMEVERNGSSPMQSQVLVNEEIHENHHEPRATELPASVGTENKEPASERSNETGKSQIKARTVLDNLLFNNTNDVASKEIKSIDGPNKEWESGTAEALEHGDKFLAWLEASGDPSVTRMHVHQLRALLHNLRSRRGPAEPAAADHAAPARRK